MKLGQFHWKPHKIPKELITSPTRAYIENFQTLFFLKQFDTTTQLWLPHLIIVIGGHQVIITLMVFFVQNTFRQGKSKHKKITFWIFCHTSWRVHRIGLLQSFHHVMFNFTSYNALLLCITLYVNFSSRVVILKFYFISFRQHLIGVLKAIFD
jgi:hypothetical protein